MRLRASLPPLVVVTMIAAVAHADRPTSPARLVDGCRRDAQSSLCREVRRLCATKAVRDDVVPACKELGWYGDTVYREITNLCPIDPTHADCQNVKSLCESKRAASIGDDGEKICREMGWGEYAYTHLDGASDADDDGEGDDDGAGGVVGGVVGGEEAGGEGGAPAAPAPAPAGTSLEYRHSWTAGMEGFGVRVGLVEDPERLGRNDSFFTVRLEGTFLSFTRVPLAFMFVSELGAARLGGAVYRADALFGWARWWTPHLATGVLAGAGVSGISDDGGEGTGVPFAVDLPLRLVGVAHAGDRVAVAGWAQVEWYAATSESRRSGSPSLGFVDAAELGAALVWTGPRIAANAGLGTGLWLGGIVQEQNGTRILSIMIGLGGAKNPWNQ